MAERPERLVVLATTGIEEYQACLLRGISPVLSSQDLARVVYVDRGETAGLPEDFVRFLRLGEPVGLLCTHLWSETHLHELGVLVRELGLPTVTIDSQLPGTTCVRGSNLTGMRALMSHLLDECGIRRPVLARGIAHQQDAVERESVFREELARRDIPVDEDLVIEGGFWSDVAHQELRALLGRRRDFDAVVACNDLSARGCIGALTDAGLRVPDDILVTGFDNNQDTLQWPGLTTVDPNLAEQGRTAAQLLLAEIAGDAPPASTAIVPSTLVIRDSTSVAPRSERDQLAAALRMVETARAHMAQQDAAAGMVRSTQSSQTLDDVIEAMGSCVSWLKLRRCFVAVRADLCGDVRCLPADLLTGSDDEKPSAQTDQMPVLRLLLDFHDGSVHPPPPDPYPAHRLLPEQLRDQLADGVLIALPLVVGEREYGYLLLERHHSRLAFHETLHVDLARALDTVFHRRALEETVARRTTQLRAEITIRRQAERRLQSANTELQLMAFQDGLTGIANRAAFEQHLSRHWEQLVPAHSPLTMLLVDVDLFKNYNDHYGHIAGDKALRIIAECLQRSTRRGNDLVARYGGEEFAAVLPRSESTAGLTVASRFQAALARKDIVHAASTIADVVTASIGVAVIHPHANVEPTDLIETADRALYRAKQLGRNRTVLIEDGEPELPTADHPVRRRP